mgnify:CR=1 FL=1
MKLDTKALALAGAILWGATLLIVGIVHLLTNGYGTIFLQMASSIYPGYDAIPSIGQLVILTGYAAVDGAIGGFLLAWLYNIFAAG